MANNKMLIDAAHPEETRVVVLRGNRVEEFDFESASKKQLRGNIYLAKVTRVEPSLQAAFVDYGGNRHGFLAFSEIHPDYYQIPVADRQALIEDEARSHQDEEEETRSSGGHRRSRRFRRGGGQQSGERRSESSESPVANAEGDAPLDPQAGHQSANDQDQSEAAAPELTGLGEGLPEQGFADTDPAQEESSEFDAAAEAPLPASTDADGPAQDHAEPFFERSESLPFRAQDLSYAISEAVPASDGVETAREGEQDLPVEAGDGQQGDNRESVTVLGEGDQERIAEPDDGAGPTDRGEGFDEPHDSEGEDDGVEQIGGDALEDVPSRAERPRRHYKIQEVIKRRQILLVQVVKEERGNKGAALTTYLSLAGRYSVLMPNTARGGGISRKITDSEDRKRLKAIAHELEVPEGMGIILRTAGAARGIAEVKRDFEYLLRMWETVRETTLQSSAPTLVYEEGSLIKRAIRDLYSKEIDEVLVSGEDGYKEARDFMRLLMPTHTRNVVPYRDPQPLFAKTGVESQLDAMFSNHVTLRSGGYLVINQTEALVAIDVNSGRSTREHNIEDTALRTNLEAADEVARQLRLRDLAGLIVVDFIDMEEGRNDRAVERRIKDALKDDRARIQIGRISHFGLLEMSRQRIRTGVLEGSTVVCAHCGGAGMVRSVSSIALHVLRLLEDALIKSAAFNLTVRTRAEIALYILNQKRTNLLDLETRFGVCITVLSDPLMTGMVYHAIERGTEATPPAVLAYHPDGGRTDAALAVEDEEDLDAGLPESEDEETEEEAAGAQARDGQAARSEGESDGQRRKRRRRRRRGRDGQSATTTDTQPSDAGSGDMAESDGDRTGEFGETGDEEEGGSEMPFAAADGMERTGGQDAQPASSLGDGSNEAASLPPQAVEAAAAFDAILDAEAPAMGEAGEPAEGEVMTSAEPDATATEEAPRRRRSRRTRSAAAETGEDATVSRRPRRSRSRAAEPVESDGPELQPSADIDIEADTARNHPPGGESGQQSELPLAQMAPLSADFVEGATPPANDVAQAPESMLTPKDEVPTEQASGTAVPTASVESESPVPPANDVGQVPTEPDPDRPKRSGWWQRAKATFTHGS